MATHIDSPAQFATLLGSSTVVVADFYADWCGPCKAIAPVFERLAAQHSKPKTVTFVKVNVDAQPQIAGQYGVSAMPTFLIFKHGSVTKTLRGADPQGLTAAVLEAVKAAGPAKPVYSSVGRTLSGAPPPPTWNMDILQAVVTFVGLYVVSFFSLDPYGAAENSPFNIHRRPPPPTTRATRTGAATQVGKRLGTIADLS